MLNINQLDIVSNLIQQTQMVMNHNPYLSPENFNSLLKINLEHKLYYNYMIANLYSNSQNLNYLNQESLTQFSQMFNKGQGRINNVIEMNQIVEDQSCPNPINYNISDTLNKTKIDEKRANSFSSYLKYLKNEQTEKENKDAILNDKAQTKDETTTASPCSVKNAVASKLGEEASVEIKKVKSFKCIETNCIKEYKSKENLTLHFKNVHLKQKPYQCSFCNSVFSHRNGETYHERKFHTQTFPHACPIESKFKFNIRL